MMKDPGEIIDLLARSLPAQSEYFLQIMLVDTFVGLSAELLRVIPLSLAWLRRRIGPNLTEKERNTSYMGLPPLAHPWEFAHADVFGDAILYFMIFFVYSAMAPITSFFVAFCLLLLGSGYRHQFFYNYPTTPDSGGKLWSNFISISLSCIVIAEITLTGFLALKKAAVATIMMFPLIGITIMFNFYIRMQHFVVTKHLPTRDCLQLDRKHFANGGLDFSFVKNKYLQPALLEREAHSTVSPVNRGLGESRNTINRRVRRSLALRV
jgi:calcium permeable stress-gated cation channel